jgi:hypothetical protein
MQNHRSLILREEGYQKTKQNINISSFEMIINRNKEGK